MKSPPKWYDKTWGHSQTDWDEARRQCRRTLIDWARAGHVGTYGELVTHVTAVPWPEGAFTGHGSMIGLLLGQVSAAEWLEDKPLLSAMAVNAELGRPSKSFFTFARDDLAIPIGPSEEAEDRWWIDEVQRCRNYPW